MTSSRIASPLLFSILIGLAGTIGAQGRQYSTPFLGQEATLTAHGDFDGDGWQDLAQLHSNGEVTLALAPAELVAFVDLTVTDVHDIATWTRSGAPDRLVLASNAGIVVVDFDAASGLPVLDAQTFAAHGAATLVEMGDFCNTNGPELAALDADSLTLRVWSSEDGALLWNDTLADKGLDLVAAAWNDRGLDDLATLSEWGLEVFSPCDGTSEPVYQQQALGSTGLLSAVSEPGVSYERLAWVTPSGIDEEQWLFVLSAFEPFEWLDLGILGAVGLVSGDRDNDGDLDLLLSARFSHELWGLTNERPETSVSFSGSTTAVFVVPYGPPATAAPDTTAWPCFADIDNDGDADATLCSASSNTLEIRHGAHVDETAWIPTLAATPEFEELFSGSSLLRLLIDEPESMPPGASHVRADVWHQPSTTAPLAPGGIGRIEVPFDGNWPLEIEIPLAVLGTSWTHVYGLQVGFLDQDDSRPFPSLLGQFTMNATVLDELTNQGAQPYLPVVLRSGVNVTGSGGGIVCRPRLGPFSRGRGPGQR